MSVQDILKGHFNEFINAEKELANERLNICKACPLYKTTAIGAVCNPNLWLNPNTGESNTESFPGAKKGCGCRLNAKVRVQYSKCPTGKW